MLTNCEYFHPVKEIGDLAIAAFTWQSEVSNLNLIM